MSVEVATTNTSSFTRGEESGSLTSRSTRGYAQKKPIHEVAKGTVFPRAPERSNPQDGPTTNFPNPGIVGTLKRLTLEEKYLLSARYRFIIPDADAIVNKPPSRCIAIY